MYFHICRLIEIFKHGKCVLCIPSIRYVGAIKQRVVWTQGALQKKQSFAIYPIDKSTTINFPTDVMQLQRKKKNCKRIKLLNKSIKRWI